jgi:hypothetical protein
MQVCKQGGKTKKVNVSKSKRRKRGSKKRRSVLETNQAFDGVFDFMHGCGRKKEKGKQQQQQFHSPHAPWPDVGSICFCFCFFEGKKT